MIYDALVGWVEIDLRPKQRKPVKPRQSHITTTARLVAKLALAQNHACSLCGAQMDLAVKASSPTGATCDHVVPKARGGGNFGNRLAAHHPCNTRKGDRMPTGCELVMLAAVNAQLGILSNRQRGETE